MRGRRQGCTDRVGTASQPPPLHFFPLAAHLVPPHPLHILFSPFASRVAQSIEKKNLSFSVWFSLRLVSSLAKSRSQFFPLRLHVASLCHPPTHLLICIPTVVACNPEGSASPAPIFSKVIIQHWCVKKRKKERRKEK